MRAVSATGVALTLVCFAHAGGNAGLYRPWRRVLPSWVEIRAVDLPGRGQRRAMAPLADWPGVIAQVGRELDDVLAASRPFAVFGHSMGALVGLEWLQAVRRDTGRQAAWFGASGSVWPACRPVEAHWLRQTDDEIVRRLRQRGGTPRELLEDADFLDMVLPVLRADFHLCGIHPLWFAQRGQMTARLEDAALPFDCPVAVFIGADDPDTASAADVSAWRRATTDVCTTHRFPGGHFFLSDAPEAVGKTIGDALTAALCDAAPRRRRA